MSSHTYLRLPINADEGFPNSFRLNVGDLAYRIVLYVNVLEQDAEVPDERVYDLPEVGAFMVMRVAREGAGEPKVIFQRKLVPNHRYDAAELSFIFRKMEVAKGNLNGVGKFGSNVVAGVASRWDS